MVDENENATEIITPAVRYRQVEEDSYAQLRTVQAMMDTELTKEKLHEGRIKTLTSVCNSLLGNYTEAQRLRKLAQIEEGRYVPMSAIEQYQREVMPSIAAGIDNLRVDILNTLSPNVRAEYDRCWGQAYKKFVVKLQEAANKMDEYIAQAQLEATGQVKKKGNDKVRHRRLITAAEKRNA